MEKANKKADRKWKNVKKQVINKEESAGVFRELSKISECTGNNAGPRSNTPDLGFILRYIY